MVHAWHAHAVPPALLHPLPRVLMFGLGRFADVGRGKRVDRVALAFRPRLKTRAHGGAQMTGRQLWRPRLSKRRSLSAHATLCVLSE